MSTKSSKRLFVNALTFSRVPLIFIYLAFAILGNFSDSLFYPFAACIAAGMAGFSDLFDGLLARRWEVVSEFGKMADPLMDKVYFIVAFPSLVWLAAVQGESAVHAVNVADDVVYLVKVAYRRIVCRHLRIEVVCPIERNAVTALSIP